MFRRLLMTINKTIDNELQMHDGSEDGEDDIDSEVIIEKLLH